MEQIGFIGSYDKKDLLLNIGKVLTSLDMKILIVDATTTQRLRYIVPMVNDTPSLTYISEYQGIDVAIGFINLNGIAQYLGTNQLNYDYVIVDTDNIQTLNYFQIPNMKKIFFVTSYDAYEIHRSLELFKHIKEPIEITKVILSADINQKQETYLNHLIEQTNVKIKQNNVEFADQIEDRKCTLENQLIREIRIKPYTSMYKYSLEYLTAMIAEGNIKQEEIKKIIRKI